MEKGVIMANQPGQQEQQNQAPPMQVDSQGFLIVDGAKVCRVEGQTLLFLDKDKRRASVRGSDQVRVPIAALTALVSRPTGPPQK